MKKSKKNSLPPFEPITSIPLTVINYSIGGLFILPLVLLVASVFVFLNENNVLAAVCITILLLVTTIFIIVHAVDVWKRIYTAMSIDEKGIHYYNKFNKKVVKTIAWKNFVKKKTYTPGFGNDLYDITIEYPLRGIRAYFCFYILVNKEEVMIKEIFQGNHIFYAFYYNRIQLIRTFLLGVKHFKPELKISPIVFIKHFIDPETFVIQYGKRRLLFFYSTLLVVLFSLICFLIFFWNNFFAQVTR